MVTTEFQPQGKIHVLYKYQYIYIYNLEIEFKTHKNMLLLYYHMVFQKLLLLITARVWR